jgi:hypothetical protein
MSDGSNDVKDENTLPMLIPRTMDATDVFVQQVCQRCLTAGHACGPHQNWRRGLGGGQSLNGGLSLNGSLGHRCLNSRVVLLRDAPFRPKAISEPPGGWPISCRQQPRIPLQDYGWYVLGVAHAFFPVGSRNFPLRDAHPADLRQENA